MLLGILTSLLTRQVEYMLEEILDEQERIRKDGAPVQSEQLTLQYKCGSLDTSLITYGTVKVGLPKYYRLHTHLINIAVTLYT